MRQVRLSIGCSDWKEIVKAIGPEAAGILVYLRTLMRSMQTCEISITVSELAESLRIPREAAETALDAISARYLERTETGGVITLRSPEEEKAMTERRRKHAARIARTNPGLRKFAAPLANGTSGNSEKDSEIPPGQVLDCGSVRLREHTKTEKNYHTDFFMCYDGNSEKKEKGPRTPQKEKSLTEHPAQAHAQTREREAELPADRLEADYIDVVGSWPPSLREAMKAEPQDVREAFYLYIRCKTEKDGRWSSDRVRIAWLAARRIPPERRAESILAAAMGDWKTIRDCGSGMYFEKDSGRIVSLVRGPVETRTGNRSAAAQASADLAVQLARSMRKD